MLATHCRPRERSATGSLPLRADFKGGSDCSTPSFGPPWSVAGRGNYDPTETFTPCDIVPITLKVSSPLDYDLWLG
jgi:hypothetical protein